MSDDKICVCRSILVFLANFVSPYENRPMIHVCITPNPYMLGSGYGIREVLDGLYGGERRKFVSGDGAVSIDDEKQAVAFKTPAGAYLLRTEPCHNFSKLKQLVEDPRMVGCFKKGEIILTITEERKCLKKRDYPRDLGGAGAVIEAPRELIEKLKTECLAKDASRLSSALNETTVP